MRITNQEKNLFKKFDEEVSNKLESVVLKETQKEKETAAVLALYGDEVLMEK